MDKTAYQIPMVKNPRVGEEIISTFQIMGATKIAQQAEKEVTFHVKYVPDKEVLTVEAFEEWIKHVCQHDWDSAEHLASEVMDVFYNSLIPFYVEVKIDIQHNSQDILVNDTKLVRKQPQFEVSTTLARLL